MSKSHRLLVGVILLYFIIALEVLIMISPFAVFFYAAFNPFLLFLAKWTATRWLADFFLPHMVLPPGPFLKTVRVTGSVLFVGGAIAFLVCAGQVYFNKLFRRVPAASGLYRWIRHPQYVALAATSLGLTILWPRFLTIVLWTVIVGLYYVCHPVDVEAEPGTIPGAFRMDAEELQRRNDWLPRDREVILFCT
jgi:protein-S-isoprenylcysteine O-methyltransferase Ste14